MSGKPCAQLGRYPGGGLSRHAGGTPEDYIRLVTLDKPGHMKGAEFSIERGKTRVISHIDPVGAVVYELRHQLLRASTDCYRCHLSAT